MKLPKMSDLVERIPSFVSLSCACFLMESNNILSQKLSHSSGMINIYHGC